MLLRPLLATVWHKLEPKFPQYTPAEETVDPLTGETVYRFTAFSPPDNTLFQASYITTVLVGAINFLLFFLFLTTLIFIIYGGYSWVTAFGNEEKITKSKKTVGWAIIGMIIIISSYAIVATITGDYFYVPYYTPPKLTNSPIEVPGIFN